MRHYLVGAAVLALVAGSAPFSAVSAAPKSDPVVKIGVDLPVITKNQQDFKALLTKAKSTNPDVVFYGGTTSTGGGLVRKQMGDVGMSKIPYMGGDGISDAEFLKIAGSMADGSYYTVAAPNAAALPSAKTFIAAYKARFSGDIGPYSANAYAAAQIEIEAIMKVLKNVAETKDAGTPIGTVGFDKNGDTTAPILSLFSVKNGKQDFVEQITLKT